MGENEELIREMLEALRQLYDEDGNAILGMALAGEVIPKAEAALSLEPVATFDGVVWTMEEPGALNTEG